MVVYKLVVFLCDWNRSGVLLKGTKNEYTENDQRRNACSDEEQLFKG